MHRLEKTFYRLLLQILCKIIGIKRTKILDTKLRFHRKLNLDNPKSLADKLCWLELNEDNMLKVLCSDKNAVRTFVKEKGLEEILVPFCCDPITDISQFDYSKLPRQFALKAAHGCEMNLICEDKGNISEKVIRRSVIRWLNHDYPRACIEPHYKKIPHSVICEQYLQNVEKIVDYKIHCFHGEPDFILTCHTRLSGLRLNTYTLDWQPLDAVREDDKCTQILPKPENLEQMIKISKALSQDFDFVRVDLYDIDGKVYFGELTFSPATGVLPYFTDEFLNKEGEKLHIESKQNSI